MFRLWASSAPANALDCPELKGEQVVDLAGAAHPAYVMSKPFLNASDGEALVAVRYESGRFGSSDRLYFLKKMTGRWVIVGQGELAVS
jgi:hypothetical protein